MGDLAGVSGLFPLRCFLLEDFLGVSPTEVLEDAAEAAREESDAAGAAGATWGAAVTAVNNSFTLASIEGA